MTQSQKLLLMAAVAISLGFAGLAAAQNTSITVQVNIGDQPAGGVDIYVSTPGNTYSPGTPPAGTTDAGGTFVLPPGLLSSIKPHTRMVEYKVCVNGKKVIFIIPEGSEDQLPKDTKDCKKEKLGFFWLDGGTIVTTRFGSGGGVTQTGGLAPVGTTAEAATHLGVGWDLAVYSGGHIIREYDEGSYAYDFQVDGAYMFPVSPRDTLGSELGAQYLQTTPVVKLGGMPPPNGTATFSNTSTGMRNFSFGARFEKTFSRFGFDLHGGPLLANVESNTKSGFCFHGATGGVMCTTNSITSSHANGFGSYLGAHASSRLSKRVSLVAGVTYDRTYPGKQADVHALVFDAGFRFHFP
ncbi:MAG TPA: hypothetical protein VJX29_07965 [Candidatus Acidoferrales bacterium]|nr:hypothetical protein [Candidatus Acidoferrales bacterium]